jgi:TetR/AcrR family transcriptional repressor of bet genes
MALDGKGRAVARTTKPEASAGRSAGRPASGRPKTLKRRRELLGVVYECISAYGIDGVSMRQIAVAAEISTGTINYHFGSKYNLIIAALEAAYEQPEDWEAYKGSPLAQLRRISNGYVFRSANDRFWRFWINYTAQGTRDDEMRRHQNDRYRRQLRFWATLLRDGVAAGELRPDIDPATTADRLLLTAHGLVIRQVLSPTQEMREHAREVLDEFFADLAVGEATAIQKPKRRRSA